MIKIEKLIVPFLSVQVQQVTLDILHSHFGQPMIATPLIVAIKF